MSAKQIEAMRKLGYSEAQIAEMLEDDKAVDRGEKMEWDLSDKDHKQAMKRANATEHKKPTEPVKRERKVDAEKGEIMSLIVEALSPIADSMGEVVNERELVFVHNAQKYKLTLSKPRK